MKLRKPCEHGFYDGHLVFSEGYLLPDYRSCPGGVFLPDDTLMQLIADALEADHSWYRCTGNHDLPHAALIVVSALSVQEVRETP